jgi:tRNA-Thr(GGU) m(6)t(6)A37 methyltransferase TsaA
MALLAGSAAAAAAAAALTTTRTRHVRCCAVDPRSLRPPLDYTSKFARDSSPVELQPIGWVSSPYKERFGTPRQPTVAAQVAGGDALEGDIVLAPQVSRHTLRGLAGFEYCWLICYMHLNTGWNPLVTPPRGPRKKQGVFATRAPHRPNPISLSALRIVNVNEDEGRVRVRGLDLLDGTPVLDIKPYVRTYDSFPDAAAGWIDDLPDAPNGPDRLPYWPPPEHLS